MALAQNFIPNNSLLFDPSSGANLTTVKKFFDDFHLGLNSNMRSDGGSVEEGEAQITLGTMTFGIRYEHPRQNYEGIDRLVIVAENTNERQFRQNIDFDVQPGDTRDTATVRWLNAARVVCFSVMATLGLPFKNAVPLVDDPQSGPVNAEPITNG